MKRRKTKDNEKRKPIMSDEDKEQEQSFGAFIPAMVLQSNKVSTGAKILYGFIHSLCKKDGYCWASNKYLMALLELKDDRPLKRMIKALANEQFIFLVLVKDKSIENYTQRRIYPFEGVKNFMTLDGIKLSRHSEYTTVKGEGVGAYNRGQGGGVKSTQGGGDNTPPNINSINKNKKRSGVPSKQELPDAPEGENSGEEKAEAIQTVFAYWQKVFSKEKSILRRVRKSKIEARLKDGFSVDQLMKAIDGVTRSDFHMGRDKKTEGRTYIEFKTIFRDEEQVEKFIEMVDKKAVNRHRSAPPVDDLSTCKLCNKGIGPCPAHRGRTIRRPETNGELNQI